MYFLYNWRKNHARKFSPSPWKPQQALSTENPSLHSPGVILIVTLNKRPWSSFFKHSRLQVMQPQGNRRQRHGGRGEARLISHCISKWVLGLWKLDLVSWQTEEKDEAIFKFDSYQARPLNWRASLAFCWRLYTTQRRLQGKSVEIQLRFDLPLCMSAQPTAEWRSLGWAAFFLLRQVAGMISLWREKFYPDPQFWGLQSLNNCLYC